MQPMLAKLPSLLLASKSKSSTGTCSTRRDKPETFSSTSRASSAARPPSSQSIASSASFTHRRIRDDDGLSASGKATSAQPSTSNNQETHDAPLKQPLRPPGLKKKKKKPAPQLSALEEVHRRKKMFSKWIKTAAATATEPSASPCSTPSTETVSIGTGVMLPPIHQRLTAVHGPEAGDIAPEMLAETCEAVDSDDFRLPPIEHHSTAHEWEFLRPYESSTKATSGDQATAADLAPDLEDSLDEDEVNNLLNWTDTLLSPSALDELTTLDDDDFDLR